MKQKYSEDLRFFIVDLILLILALAAVYVAKDEMIITLIVIGLVFATWYHHHIKNEFLLFVIGTVLGFVFEFIGDYFYELQYWSEGILPGMPLWLPFFWGYGFIVIHRLGDLLVKK